MMACSGISVLSSKATIDRDVKMARQHRGNRLSRTGFGRFWWRSATSLHTQNPRTAYQRLPDAPLAEGWKHRVRLSGPTTADFRLPDLTQPSNSRGADYVPRQKPEPEQGPTSFSSLRPPLSSTTRDTRTADTHSGRRPVPPAQRASSRRAAKDCLHWSGPHA